MVPGEHHRLLTIVLLCTTLSSPLLASAPCHAQTLIYETSPPTTVDIPGAEPATPPAGAALPAQQLYLLVSINGRDTGLVAEFSLGDDARMSSPKTELQQLGIKLPPDAPDKVYLDQLPGLTYAYDEQIQAIAITVTNDALSPQLIGGNSEGFVPAQLWCRAELRPLCLDAEHRT